MRMAMPIPVAIESGGVKLSPENSKIEFVGTHVGDNPDPRTGGFAKFSGKIEVDPDAKTVKAIKVEIETASLWTSIDRLTNHLKSPDFFDVREHPKAEFQSTSITAGERNGSINVTGDLTLLETTKEITFPANFIVSGAGMILRSHFTIDRTEFGMEFGPDRVQKEISLTVAVGEKTQIRQGQGSGGGKGKGKGGRGGRGRGPGGPGGDAKPKPTKKG